VRHSVFSVGCLRCGAAVVGVCPAPAFKAAAGLTPNSVRLTWYTGRAAGLAAGAAVAAEAERATMAIWSAKGSAAFGAAVAGGAGMPPATFTSGGGAGTCSVRIVSPRGPSTAGPGRPITDCGAGPNGEFDAACDNMPNGEANGLVETPLGFGCFGPRTRGGPPGCGTDRSGTAAGATMCTTTGWTAGADAGGDALARASASLARSPSASI
jgi:hypothetical protein